MPTNECPLCHSQTSLANRVPYCAQCGWNRDKAIATLQANVKMIPFAFVLFAAFMLVAIVTSRRGIPPVLLILFGLPILVFAFSIASVRRTLNKLRALPAPTSPLAAQSRGSSAANAGAPTFEPSPQDQAILRTSRPRQIHMATYGKLSVAFALLAVVAFEVPLGTHLLAVWTRTPSFMSFEPKFWVMAAAAALLLLIPFWLWRNQAKECDLLENGEVAMGRVIRQWNSGRNSSSIEYTFKDFEGHEQKGVGIDYTMKLFEGMAVPVFYDCDNPKRKIAPCSTYHEVVT